MELILTICVKKCTFYIGGNAPYRSPYLLYLLYILCVAPKYTFGFYKREEMKLKDYVKLLRIRHYIKNLLVFLPMFFGGNIFNTEKLISAGMGFVCFCFVSSGIYILNDYRDREKDRLHPKKKERPIASGRIKPVNALVTMVVCLIIAGVLW